MQSKYGNKYRKLCIKKSLIKDDSIPHSVLSKYFSQIKVVAGFTLTPSPYSSTSLFIGITGVRVKVRVG